MFKRTAVFLFLSLVALCPVLAQSPGSTSDPLVSKSYVDRFLNFHKSEFKAKTVLKPHTGAMIILLSGTVKCSLGKGSSLIDLTLGAALKNGRKLSLNHLYIVAGDSDIKLVFEKNGSALLRSDQSSWN